MDPEHFYYPPEGNPDGGQKLMCKQRFGDLWNWIKKWFNKARTDFGNIENQLQKTSCGKACLGLLTVFLIFCIVIAPILLGVGVIDKYKDYFDEYQYHRKAMCINISSVFKGRYKCTASLDSTLEL